MLKLATLLDNPGEPLPATRYRDPRHLAELGYNGLVIYKTTGLSGLDAPEAVGGGEMSRWVQQQFEQVDQTIAKADDAGLDVYICYDTLTLPRTATQQNSDGLSCRGRPNVLCPGSDEALERSARALDALLSRWSNIAGVVLRFGDTDANRLRYLVGNDIYQPHCPRCSGLGRVSRISRFIDRFHDVVVADNDKRLIVRAWNVRPNGMHDTPDVCERLAPRLPGDETDDRLVLSFKFTQTDFWRYQRWNSASLSLGKRPIIYELQCQREFEGKGGIPNWQPPLWRDGAPEMAGHEESGSTGLAQVAGKVNLVGLWAWVRGGGWGGPFVQNETWIDANVVAVPQLADDPATDLNRLADDWTHQRMQLADATADVVKSVLQHSTDSVLRGFYIAPFARGKGSPWHPNGDWIQDDVLDAEAAWRMVQRQSESDLDAVVQEKRDAVEQVKRDLAALTAIKPERKHAATIEAMINTLQYAESFYRTVRDLLTGMVAYRKFKQANDASAARQCGKALLAAQSHWNHHTQRMASVPGTATPFREAHFWDITQRMLDETTAHV